MRWVPSVVALLVLVGCQQSPPAGPPEPPPGWLVQRLRAEGDELAARGEYEVAAVKYQAAADQEPDDIALRFRLGTALSHLGRRQETVGQFQWVVMRGHPASPEVQVARRWLVGAGVLAEPRTFSFSSSVPAGKVGGRTGWRGTDTRDGPRRVSLVLRGDDESNREVVLETSVRLGDPYEFGSVPPGTYRLTARVGQGPFWEQKVTVEPGEETVLDLVDAGESVGVAGLPGTVRQQE